MLPDVVTFLCRFANNSCQTDAMLVMIGHGYRMQKHQYTGTESSAFARCLRLYHDGECREEIFVTTKAEAQKAIQGFEYGRISCMEMGLANLVGHLATDPVMQAHFCAVDDLGGTSNGCCAVDVATLGDRDASGLLVHQSLSACVGSGKHLKYCRETPSFIFVTVRGAAEAEAEGVNPLFLWEKELTFSYNHRREDWVNHEGNHLHTYRIDRADGERPCDGGSTTNAESQRRWDLQGTGICGARYVLAAVAGHSCNHFTATMLGLSPTGVPCVTVSTHDGVSNSGRVSAPIDVKGKTLAELGCTQKAAMVMYVKMPFSEPTSGTHFFTPCSKSWCVHSVQWCPVLQTKVALYFSHPSLCGMEMPPLGRCEKIHAAKVMEWIDAGHTGLSESGAVNLSDDTDDPAPSIPDVALDRGCLSVHDDMPDVPAYQTLSDAARSRLYAFVERGGFRDPEGNCPQHAIASEMQGPLESLHPGTWINDVVIDRCFPPKKGLYLKKGRRPIGESRSCNFVLCCNSHRFSAHACQTDAMLVAIRHR